jgi:arylsulfatase A-like enzyme
MRYAIALVVLGLPIVLWGCGSEPGGNTDGKPVERPNLVLITLDTTRADRLGCYGYQHETSPNLDRLAQESMLYTRAYATSSWTLPSHGSIFTGKLPTSHGAQYDPEGPLSIIQGIEGHPAWESFRARTIAEDEVTLAEILLDAGYATAGVVGGPWMKKAFGLDRGFEFYDDSQISELNGRPAADVVRSAVEWLEREGDEPFFLFLNLFDPHEPYQAPREFQERIRAHRRVSRRNMRDALYDAEILYMDHHIGVLIEELRELDLYERSWIIVTADHGELLGDNGLFGHGTSLSEAEIRVPLMVKGPGGVSRRSTGVRDTPVLLTDILPTILQHLRVAAPPEVQGASFDVVDHPIVAEVYPLPITQKGQRHWRQKGDWRVLIEGHYKFAWNSLGRHLLVDLAKDPGEEVNLVSSHRDLAERMATQLNAYFEDLPAAGRPGPLGEIDEETRRALEGLGYVEGQEDGGD